MTRVSLFITCLGDLFAPEVGEAAVRVLHRLGVKVDFPHDQTCCGQPAFNSGYAREAREVARGLIRAFRGNEAVVCPSGSCAAMVRHFYPSLFAGDPFEEEARAFAARTYEFSEFVVEQLGVEDVNARFPARATYHSSCHMTRELGVKDAPLRLLRNVRDLELVDLPASEDCCGFGGTFAVKLPEVSVAMGEAKATAVRSTGADVLIASDCGCLMQIGGRLHRTGNHLRILHVAQVLDEGMKER